MPSSLNQFELLGPMEDDPSQLLVRRRERLFRVSEGSWKFIDGVCSGKTDSEISQSIESYFKYGPITAHKLERIKSHISSKLEERAIPNASSPLWVTIDFIRQDKLTSIVEKFPIIPRGFIGFYALLFISLCLNCLFIATKLEIFDSWHGKTVSVNTAMHSAIIIAAMFIISVCHEIGHAAAARNFGLRPARIGAGLFLIFPALFADVSEIWRLRRTKRIVVNLAGAFIQLWIGVLLAAMMVAAPLSHSSILLSIYVINLSTILINLMPFSKLDGYWVLADALDCPDLQARSFRLLARVAGFRTEAYDRGPINKLLVLFGLCNLAFYVAIMFAGVSFAMKYGLEIVTSRDPIYAAVQIFLSHPVGFLVSAFVAYRLTAMLTRLAKMAATRK